MPKDEIRRRVDEAARILDLEPLLKRKPRALSGGQRQRVAMGRAIVRQPAAFLMDEPLSNLDAKLRVQMRADIKRIQADLGVTTIYVTHDQVEAMTMGHRVAVMRKGELQQVAAAAGALRPPGQRLRRRLHRKPGDEHARGAASSAATAAFEIVVGSRGSRSTRRLSPAHPALAAYEGRDDRARHPAREPRGRGARRTATASRGCAAEAEMREALGSEVLVHFSIAARPAVTDDVRELAEDVGDDRALEQLAEGVPARAALVGRFSPDTRDSRGRRDRGCRRPSVALHFFDPESGLAI